MQIPIITDETLAQMSLMRLTSHVLALLSEALPHVTNIETAEANAKASAEAAETSASSAATSAAAAEESFTKVDPAVNAGIARINAAVTTVLNTEV